MFILITFHAISTALVARPFSAQTTRSLENSSASEFFRVSFLSPAFAVISG